APGAYDVGADVFRVRLDRDLGIGSERRASRDRLDEEANAARAELGGSTAAEVQRAQAPGLVTAEPDLELTPDGVHVLVDWNRPPDRDREITVRAASRAKRHVNVQVTREHTEL